MPLGARQRIAMSIANLPLVDRLTRCLIELPQVRIVPLAPLYQRELSAKRLEQIEQGSEFNDVLTDLVDFTGLTLDQVKQRVRRQPRFHHESEFNWAAPVDSRELAWFYRCSQGYLFGNAAHPYWKKLDFLQPDNGRVLDYGAGIGANVVGLAKRGFQVDCLEINLLQEEFILQRCQAKGYHEMRIVKPTVAGVFDPIACIQDSYRAIVLQDVLEHIPDYHILLRHLIDHLEPSGYIIEKSPFAQEADEIDIHIVASVPLKEAMAGMRQIETGIWQKIS